MTPREAAVEYLRLSVLSIGAGIRFAHEYEDSASEEDFDSWIAELDAIEAGE